jgi:hypothetical protein
MPQVFQRKIANKINKSALMSLGCFICYLFYSVNIALYYNMIVKKKFKTSINYVLLVYVIFSGSVVVKALCCKPEGRGFKS